MPNREVHEPELPGVKTYAKDVAKGSFDDEEMGVSFGGAKGGKAAMHVPESIPAPANSLLTNRDDVFDVSHAFDTGMGFGTIITDKKHKRRTVFTVTGEAFDEWKNNALGGIRSLKIFKKKEKQHMAPLEARRDVVAEAATNTAQAPWDDHEVVIEKLKTLKHDAEKITGKPFVLKEKKDIPIVPSWKYTKDDEKNEPKLITPEKITVEPVVSAPHIRATAPETNGVYDFTQKEELPVEEPRASVHAPQQPLVVRKEASVTPHVEEIAVTKEPQEVTGYKSQVESSLPEEAHPEPEVVRIEEKPRKRERVDTQALAYREEVALSRPRAIPAAVVEARPRPAPEPEAAPFVPQERRGEHPFRARIIVGMVIAVCSLLGVATAVLFIRGGDEGPREEVSTAPSAFIMSDASLPIPLSNDHDAFVRDLNTAVEGAGTGVTHLYPTDGNGALASTERIFSVLAPNVNGGFVRSLTETTMLGSVTTDTNEPFIIIRSHTFDSAFAGMLEWEAHMDEDLAVLFPDDGEAASAQEFMDATRENRSIRILYDGAGEERIVYAFVTRDTIVITGSIEALSAIIRKL